MYQFTRDFVINSNKGKLTSGKRFEFNAKHGVFMIDGVDNFRAQDIAAVYKYNFVPATAEKLDLQLSEAPIEEVKPGSIFRLVLTLGQEGREIATFNDQYPHHVRRYFYEGMYEESMDEVYEGILAGMQRDLALSDDRYFKFDEEELKSGHLVLEALDPYTRFVNVRFVKIGKEEDECCREYPMLGETLTGFCDWVKCINKNRKQLIEDGELTPGTEGNGNVAQIIKNLRVPTMEHMDWFGTMRDELPVANGEYDQYLIEKVTERRHIGHQVMGPIDHSLVSFVFYVNRAGCDESASAQFESDLTDLLKLCNPEIKIAEINKEAAEEGAEPVDQRLFTAAPHAWVEGVPASDLVAHVGSNPELERTPKQVEGGEPGEADEETVVS